MFAQKNHTRFGYTEKKSGMKILKRRGFARWQAGERLPDAALCKAAREMEGGLIAADLGGMLYKMRVARAGGGKAGGYRTLVVGQNR